ncbi:hypothetical protein FNV43_RR16630 [Rhamnella rubrinervis]|uniref:Uncharacterized protein n=1 Tax=Rhamnella rubrinervis TaxID=2594499 RepID=A0A8K0GZ51_9ROSA|nr:hypothetical protein FNV43_RR16630 [Rhamnella rubrinervis]
MKLSTKPISSPGRTEKFPPPLMRFLRSNVGSRSRGRSRSSPMFVRKKSTATIETQEPSSPKVTCMGQVRVRRSSKQAATRTSGSRRREARGHRCKWIRNALFCSLFSGKIKPKSSSCGPVWRKWVFFQVGFRRKSQISENSSKIASKFGSRNEDSDEEEEDDDEGDEREANKVFVCSSSTPPKNALLLTRCRSAPYRSSSLASRFWGSPPRSEETGEEEEQKRTEPKYSTIVNNKNEKKPTSELESIASISNHQEAIIDPKVEEEKLGLFKELEDSIRKRITESANTEESKQKKN